MCLGGYLDGGRGHLPSLVEVEGHYVGEAAGVGVHRGGAVAKSLQDGVDRLPLLSCVTKKKNVKVDLNICSGTSVQTVLKWFIRPLVFFLVNTYATIIIRSLSKSNQ